MAASKRHPEHEVHMRFIGRLVGRLIGLSVLAGLVTAAAAAVAKGRLVSSGEPDDDQVALVTIFDGLEFVSTASAFRGGSVLCWYGGSSIDLRGATLDPEGATLDVRTLFGGLRLVVPPEWRIRREAVAILGGIADSRGGSDDAQATLGSGPTLTLTGWAVFGGVAIMAEAPDLDAGTAESGAV
jgi:hypothetical protein